MVSPLLFRGGPCLLVSLDGALLGTRTCLVFVKYPTGPLAKVSQIMLA